MADQLIIDLTRIRGVPAVWINFVNAAPQLNYRTELSGVMGVAGVQEHSSSQGAIFEVTLTRGVTLAKFVLALGRVFPQAKRRYFLTRAGSNLGGELPRPISYGEWEKN